MSPVLAPQLSLSTLPSLPLAAPPLLPAHPVLSMQPSSLACPPPPPPPPWFLPLRAAAWPHPGQARLELGAWGGGHSGLPQALFSSCHLGREGKSMRVWGGGCWGWD